MFAKLFLAIIIFENLLFVMANHGPSDWTQSDQLQLEASYDGRDIDIDGHERGLLQDIAAVGGSVESTACVNALCNALASTAGIVPGGAYLTPYTSASWDGSVCSCCKNQVSCTGAIDELTNLGILAPNSPSSGSNSGSPSPSSPSTGTNSGSPSPSSPSSGTNSGSPSPSSPSSGTNSGSPSPSSPSSGTNSGSPSPSLSTSGSYSGSPSPSRSFTGSPPSSTSTYGTIGVKASVSNN